MAALTFLAILFAIIVVAVFTLSWAVRWPAPSRRWTVIALVYGTALSVLGVIVVAWFFGLLRPIQSYIAQRETNAFEQHLSIGESRTELQRQFGHGVPTPDRIRDEAGDYYYEYISAQGMCFQEYRGFKVEYSIHGDYIVSWEPVSDGDGC